MLKIAKYTPADSASANRGNTVYARYEFEDGQVVETSDTASPVFTPPTDSGDEYLAAIDDAHEFQVLKADIIHLHLLGYEKAWLALPCPIPADATAETLRCALRSAGFTDEEISERDYSRGDCI